MSDLAAVEGALAGTGHPVEGRFALAGQLGGGGLGVGDGRVAGAGLEAAVALQALAARRQGGRGLVRVEV